MSLGPGPSKRHLITSHKGPVPKCVSGEPIFLHFSRIPDSETLLQGWWTTLVIFCVSLKFTYPERDHISNSYLWYNSYFLCQYSTSGSVSCHLGNHVLQYSPYKTCNIETLQKEKKALKKCSPKLGQFKPHKKMALSPASFRGFYPLQ